MCFLVTLVNDLRLGGTKLFKHKSHFLPLCFIQTGYQYHFAIVNYVVGYVRNFPWIGPKMKPCDSHTPEITWSQSKWTPSTASLYSFPVLKHWTDLKSYTINNLYNVAYIDNKIDVYGALREFSCHIHSYNTNISVCKSRINVNIHTKLHYDHDG